MPATSDSIQLRAPAKVNLSLRVLRQRPDGFHEIETLMAPISLADEITIARSGSPGGIDFTCDDPTLPSGADNLVMRAAELFRTMARVDEGLQIALMKKIPHGAGLGGGSSDAATTLLGLNALFREPFTSETVHELASQLGSDVPFFLVRNAAICRGRGEIVTRAPLNQPLEMILIKPEFGVPTPWAYSRWAVAKNLAGIDYSSQKVESFEIVNDLEKPVFEKFIFLARIKFWLLRQTEIKAALLSGSGSTMIGFLRNGVSGEKLAMRARAELDPRFWTSVCRTV